MSNGTTLDNWQAWLLCHNYDFVPIDSIKYEKVVPTDHIGSHFIANTSNNIKILIQYDDRQLQAQE